MGQHEGVTSDEIDGYHYKVFMLDPLIAADIIADVGYIMAPVMGALSGMMSKAQGDDVLSAVLDGETDEEGEPLVNAEAALEKAVLGFFDRFDKVKQRELIALMSKVTMVVMPDGKEPVLKSIFSEHFRGRIKSLYAWFWFAMKTQFSDFFSGQGGDMSRAIAKVAAAMPGR